MLWMKRGKRLRAIYLSNYLSVHPQHWSCPLLSRISCVLVVPTEPRSGLVASLRRSVKPLVHPPQRVEAASIRGVGVVDDAVGERERTHVRRFASVGGDIGAGHNSKLGWTL